MSEHIPLSLVQDLALRHGFQACGASKAESLPSDFFFNYLNLNYNALMLFLRANIQKRLDPTLLFNGAKTVFSFVLSYNNGVQPVHNLRIASYALCKNYHKLLKSKLYAIVQTIKTIYPDFQFCICVDSAPVFEKIWAKRANLGAIGKNGLFISKTHGSKVFLGEIITNFESDYTMFQSDDPCGNCSLCLSACPNAAIGGDKMVNANRCIAYHTKLNRNSIPQEIDMQRYIFGCDICLDVCPHNRQALLNDSEDVQPLDAVTDLLSKVSQQSFTVSDLRKAAKISGLEGIKYSKFVSNIASAVTDF